MPIYEYHCKACEEDFETIQKVGDAKPVCPKCGSRKVTKKVSKSSFVLKGSGWYATDFKDKDKKTAEAKKPATPAKAESAPGTEAAPSSDAVAPAAPTTTEKAASEAPAPKAEPAKKESVTSKPSKEK